ncbi:Rhamnosyltransferase [Gammaproteobacteria bacterium]
MLRQQAATAIMASNLEEKLGRVRQLDPSAPVDTSELVVAQGVVPGREALPLLVEPDQLAKRSVGSLQGRAALIHALAHIELNAVDLGLDIVWRFAGMPTTFYRDWIGVAKEEAHHFTLLRDHLRNLGHNYGDFPAHNGLWEMAEKTAGDLLARLALVPRTLEARGLDAAPPIREKLRRAGDGAGAAILDIILRDEIGHVAIGNRWYRHLCAERELEPLVTYTRLANQHGAPRLRGPFNLEARRAAGFSEAELLALQHPAGSSPPNPNPNPNLVTSE